MDPGWASLITDHPWSDMYLVRRCVRGGRRGLTEGEGAPTRGVHVLKCSVRRPKASRTAKWGMHAETGVTEMR